KHRQISRQKVAFANSSACFDSSSCTFFRRSQVAVIAIDPCQIEHSLRCHAKEGVLRRDVRPLFQIFACFLTIALSNCEFSVVCENLRLVAVFLVLSSDAERIVKSLICFIELSLSGQRQALAFISHVWESAI